MWLIRAAVSWNSRSFSSADAPDTKRLKAFQTTPFQVAVRSAGKLRREKTAVRAGTVRSQSTAGHRAAASGQVDGARSSSREPKRETAVPTAPSLIETFGRSASLQTCAAFGRRQRVGRHGNGRLRGVRQPGSAAYLGKSAPVPAGRPVACCRPRRRMAGRVGQAGISGP